MHNKFIYLCGSVYQNKILDVCIVVAVLVSLKSNYAFSSDVQTSIPPPQEFWEYFSDYGNENGEIIDPLELEQLASIHRQSDTGGVDKSDMRADDVTVKHADMKLKNSNTHSSTSSIKGEPL